jgi:hypothetical protein
VDFNVRPLPLLIALPKELADDLAAFEPVRQALREALFIRIAEECALPPHLAGYSADAPIIVEGRP